jgi:hypothetical protein
MRRLWLPVWLPVTGRGDCPAPQGPGAPIGTYVDAVLAVGQAGRGDDGGDCLPPLGGLLAVLTGPCWRCRRGTLAREVQNRVGAEMIAGKAPAPATGAWSTPTSHPACVGRRRAVPQTAPDLLFCTWTVLDSSGRRRGVTAPRRPRSDHGWPLPVVAVGRRGPTRRPARADGPPGLLSIPRAAVVGIRGCSGGVGGGLQGAGWRWPTVPLSQTGRENVAIPSIPAVLARGAVAA